VWSERPWFVWPAAVDPGWCAALAERLRSAPFTDEALGLHGNFCYERLAEPELDALVRAKLEEASFVTELSARVGRPLAPSVEGLVKRVDSAPHRRFPWHSDGSRGREIAVSLSLSAGPVQGGRFQLRRKWSAELLADLAQGRPGDVHAFEVGDPTLVHRVTPVEGPEPRVFFAGWYRGA